MRFPADLGFARTVDASASTTTQFYAPRPIVNAEIVRLDHPVFYGYTEKVIPVKYLGGPLMSVAPSDQANVLAKYIGGDAAVNKPIRSLPDAIRIGASACPHDCPSTCALEVEVLDERTIGRVRGAPDNSYTAGVICAKVARYAERVHHPDYQGCKYVLQLSHSGRQQDLGGVENQYHRSLSSTGDSFGVTPCGSMPSTRSCSCFNGSFIGVNS